MRFDISDGLNIELDDFGGKTRVPLYTFTINNGFENEETVILLNRKTLKKLAGFINEYLEND